jgi:hypothetical protein
MPRSLTALIAFLFFSSTYFAQKDVSKTDSMLIVSGVNAIFSVFDNPVFSEFEKRSTKSIYCIICIYKPDFTTEPYMIERQRFYNLYLNEIRQSDSFIRAKKSTDFILIKENNHRSDVTVLFTTHKRDELAPGHEGAQLGMYFKKVNKAYKFAGIETIP